MAYFFSHDVLNNSIIEKQLNLIGHDVKRARIIRLSDFSKDPNHFHILVFPKINARLIYTDTCCT